MTFSSLEEAVVTYKMLPTGINEVFLVMITSRFKLKVGFGPKDYIMIYLKATMTRTIG